MASIFADFHEAQRIGSGHLLASCLAPINTEHNPRRLESFSQLSNYQTVSADVRYYVLQDRSIPVKLPKAEGNAWVDIFTAFWTCVRELILIERGVPNAAWAKAFDSYKELCNRLVRGYSTDGLMAWTVPCLYVTGKYLRIIAMKADVELKAKDVNGFGSGFGDDIIGNTDKNEKLEQAAWVINRMFTICLSDRSELSESRKWGIYSSTNLLFKTYFKLNSISLCKNVLRALVASEAEIPELNRFPKSHRVTFKYYRGVIAFLQEDYAEAEEHLTEAFQLCHRDSHKNRERILTYLIPCHLLTTRTLPSAALLQPYPTLTTLFRPLSKAIRAGSLSDFDTALAAGESEFVARRIYLTLERGRDICLRNLFRKVFLAGGFEVSGTGGDSKNEGPPHSAAVAAGETEPVLPKVRRTRIPVAEFEAGMRISLKNEKGEYRPPVAGEVEMVDRDEVECFLANLIYKNLMKGYIARDRGIVVLSKTGAFPGTGV